MNVYLASIVLTVLVVTLLRMSSYCDWTETSFPSVSYSFTVDCAKSCIYFLRGGMSFCMRVVCLRECAIYEPM